MVNTFDSTLMEKVMVYVDIEDKGILKYEYLVEESISVAASLCSRLLRQGMEVGIRVNAEEEEGKQPQGYIKPAGGRQQIAEIERMPARRKAEEAAAAFSSILTEPEEDAVLIVISKNAAENQEAIEKLCGKDRQGIWVVPFPRGEECMAKESDHVCIIGREVERT